MASSSTAGMPHSTQVCYEWARQTHMSVAAQNANACYKQHDRNSVAGHTTFTSNPPGHNPNKQDHPRSHQSSFTARHPCHGQAPQAGLCGEPGATLLIKPTENPKLSDAQPCAKHAMHPRCHPRILWCVQSTANTSFENGCKGAHCAF